MKEILEVDNTIYLFAQRLRVEGVNSMKVLEVGSKMQDRWPPSRTHGNTKG